MDRLFLDANVIVSAALTPESRLPALWQLTDARLLGSPYVIEEATRNVATDEDRTRLDGLLSALAVLPAEPSDVTIDGEPELAQKDRPVLQAAIAAGATHLLTGDLTHFGPLMGRSYGGVTVMLPGEYLRSR